MEYKLDKYIHELFNLYEDTEEHELRLKDKDIRRYR